MAIIIPTNRKMTAAELANMVKNNAKHPSFGTEETGAAPKQVADPILKGNDPNIKRYLEKGYNPLNITTLPKPIDTTNSGQLPTVSNEEKASARDKLRALSVADSKKKADNGSGLPPGTPGSDGAVNQQGNDQLNNQGAAPVQYNGMSFDQYKQSLIDSVRAGVMTEYEANASIIRNNLAQAMSELQNELAALEPLYQTQLDTIAKNQYTTGERTKETLNQGGWNTSNSGLAVGEHTKIANAADESRAEAGLAKTQAEENINRQRTLQEQLANNDLASLEAQKNAKLAGAEAEAMIHAEDRYRQMYESDRSYDLQQKQFSESIRQFNEQLKSRTSSEKLADLKDGASLSAEEKDTLATNALTWIFNQEDINKTVDDMLADPELPTEIKKTVLDMMKSRKDYQKNDTGWITEEEA
ncbi:hypothetical protein EOM86_03525 [Candidatus Nomurabacteria bacterium]|nr:hypothetical protein [Candidatus Nomurabacteria bacterium]